MTAAESMHEKVRAAVLDDASDIARWYPSLGADVATRMAEGALSPKEALRVLHALRERHANENWLRPKAPAWQVCLVRDHAHTDMVTFLASVGCSTFGRWFVTTFASGKTLDVADTLLDESDE